MPKYRLAIPSTRASATPPSRKALVGLGVRLSMSIPVTFSRRTGVTAVDPMAGRGLPSTLPSAAPNTLRWP